MKNIQLIFCFFLILSLSAQDNTNKSKFRQLAEDLPTPNVYRTASGAPGHEYWQQRADYNIKLNIDDVNKTLTGSERITYHNNSPDDLSYLWLQLDQNVRAKDSDKNTISTSKVPERMSTNQLSRMEPTFDGGFKITRVTNTDGISLKYHINKTMMRIELPEKLKPGKKYSFDVSWYYNINNTKNQRGRSGYEHFDEDDNSVYLIAQFYPRMCMYNDIYGWQNKQFLGRGEFTLTFGDYKVEITVPSDHLVASTGTLQNPDKVLSKIQKQRLEKASAAKMHPVIIASKEEADERLLTKSPSNKTWVFHAENVRDFAFASSRRFIWDAIGVKMSDGRTVMAQSMWVKEGDCLWSKYSTKAVAHTLKWYSHYTFDYPYPAAWSIDGSMGMEYPMICFNFGRCEDDNTYKQRTKYGHIGVIIHEVGHNWFPMIINSDERQWTWMDEGLNTFMQYLTEQQWERDYPSRRGPAHKIVNYMSSDKERLTPIMTNSESLFQFGDNAYGKPATALNILRETVMGRELFDYAFKEYANRWKFKHPTPADFFRTMEDASAVDLDWFWRGWFYTTDHVDMSLSVSSYKTSSKNPMAESDRKKAERSIQPENISTIRNREEIKQTLNEIDTSINDYYTIYDPLDYDLIDEQEYSEYLTSLSEEDKQLLGNSDNFYEITFKNEGGLIMPIIIEFEYEDGTKEINRIPAEIWRFNSKEVTKTFKTDKEIINFNLDPFLETADINRDNNYYPPRNEENRFEIYKRRNSNREQENPMQRNNRIKELENKVNKP